MCRTVSTKQMLCENAFCEGFVDIVGGGRIKAQSRTKCEADAEDFRNRENFNFCENLVPSALFDGHWTRLLLGRSGC